MNSIESENSRAVYEMREAQCEAQVTCVICHTQWTVQPKEMVSYKNGFAKGHEVCLPCAERVAPKMIAITRRFLMSQEETRWHPDAPFTKLHAAKLYQASLDDEMERLEQLRREGQGGTQS